MPLSFRFFAKKYRFSPADSGRIREAILARMATLAAAGGKHQEQSEGRRRLHGATSLCEGLLSNFEKTGSPITVHLTTTEREGLFWSLESYRTDLERENGWRLSDALEREIAAITALQKRLRSDHPADPASPTS